MASLEADGFGESLFEGMVLFSPSDLSSSPPSDDPPPPPPPPAAAPPPPPAAAPPSPAAVPPPIVSAPPPPLSSTTSQPLDEDLFSDLTVQTQTLIQLPDLPPSTAPPPSTTPPSRQISRRKKRAVRIGYGRDSAFDPDDALPVTEDANPNPNSPHPGPITPPSPPELPEPSPKETDQTEHRSSNIVLDDALTAAAASEKEEITVAVSEDVTVVAPEKEDEFCSIEAKLELVKGRITEKLERIRETAASLSFERKELFRRRRKATEDVGLATARHIELEKELEEACEAEDFEKAERVSDGLAAAEKEKDGLLGALRNVEIECDATDLKLLEVLELQIAAEEEGAVKLEQFAKDATDHADLVLQNAEEISAKELEEWQLSMELLEMEKLQMGIESQLVFEKRSGLEHSIEHLVEDERKASDELRRKKVTLATELDELLQLVRLKEAEIAENDSKIQAVEKRISDVFSEFNETRSDIDTKHEKLQSALSKIESESEALAMKKREMDEFIFRAREKRSKLVELANTHLDDARTYRNLVGLRKSLASSVLKSREDKVRLAETEEKILGEIQILKQHISTGRITLQELSSTRASIQQEIASVKQRVGFIDRRGPELEAEKKVAAAARNFKEAGRVAAEAKALGLEKDSLLNKLEKAASDLEKLEEEIKGTLSNIQESEGLISLKEKDAAMTACMRLQLVATAARAERSAALESGDTEEGDILLKEAEAAESKAKELQGAYDLELEEHGKTHEHLVSIALITNLAGQYLTEMASSFSVSASDS